VEETSEYVGALVSRHSVQVLPRVSGYVREILVTPGQTVKARQRLLRIDARQEAAVLAQSSASLAQTETQLKLATSTRARIETLVREGIRSRQDLDAASAEEQAARAAVNAARANVRAQSVQVAYHDVVAPFAGRVGDIVVKVGDAVDAQTVLTQVDESDDLEISVAVPVERAGQVTPGQTPLELLDEEGKPLGRSPVFFVSPRPDARTQLVELRARFENPGQLRSGQRVRVRVVWRGLQALTVPTYAITRQTGQAFVFTAAGDRQGQTTVQRRPVTLGMITGDRWTVTRGLQAGDRVAVSRTQALRDGQPVQITRTASDKEGG
jgi:RND family efflux transporter MFP subunit